MRQPHAACRRLLECICQQGEHAQATEGVRAREGRSVALAALALAHLRLVCDELREHRKRGVDSQRQRGLLGRRAMRRSHAAAATAAAAATTATATATAADITTTVSATSTANVATNTQILPLKRYCDVVEKDLGQIATTRSWIGTRQAVLGQKPPTLDSGLQMDPIDEDTSKPDDGGDGYYNGPEMMPPGGGM